MYEQLAKIFRNDYLCFEQAKSILVFVGTYKSD